MEEKSDSWVWWVIGGIGTLLAIAFAVLTGRAIPKRNKVVVVRDDSEKRKREKAEVKLRKAEKELDDVLEEEDPGDRLDGLVKLGRRRRDDR